MNNVYLLLGSNEGDKMKWLEIAKEMINKNCGKILQTSSCFETAAWGIESQPDFVNQVAVLATMLSPLSLLKEIQKIEKEAGRQRAIKWGQRTLDIDILFFNNEVINNDKLVIPHPYLHERRFTLAPLFEIAPNLVHPVFKKTIEELLMDCKDPLEVKKTEI